MKSASEGSGPGVRRCAVELVGQIKDSQHGTAMRGSMALGIECSLDSLTLTDCCDRSPATRKLRIITGKKQNKTIFLQGLLGVKKEKKIANYLVQFLKLN